MISLLLLPLRFCCFGVDARACVCGCGFCVFALWAVVLWVFLWVGLLFSCCLLLLSVALWAVVSLVVLLLLFAVAVGVSLCVLPKPAPDSLVQQ